MNEFSAKYMFSYLNFIRATAGYTLSFDVKVKVTLEQATKAQRWSTLSLTSALDRGRVVNATPRPLHPRERPGTHCIGGWVGPRAGLDGCGKSRPHRDSIPGPSSP